MSCSLLKMLLDAKKTCSSQARDAVGGDVPRSVCKSCSDGASYYVISLGSDPLPVLVTSLAADPIVSSVLLAWYKPMMRDSLVLQGLSSGKKQRKGKSRNRHPEMGSISNGDTTAG